MEQKLEGYTMRTRTCVRVVREKIDGIFELYELRCDHGTTIVEIVPWGAYAYPDATENPCWHCTEVWVRERYPHIKV